MVNKVFKDLTGYLLIGTVFISSIFVPVKNIYAADTLYEQKKVETVTKGVTYELNRRLTDEGWLDINVLRISLEDANITVGPVQSTKELGLKEPLIDLLYNNGAIAGVNSDFFGMNGTYSTSFGTAIKDGNIIATSDDRNNVTDDYATFFIDTNNMPFMDFMRISFEFLNNGAKNIDINAINKAGDKVYAMKMDRNGGENTKSLDNRFSNLVKLVIEDDIITYISLKGETVNVPENGYLIVMNEQWYDERVDAFAVGQTAEFKVNSSISLDAINTSIGGGAKILENGVAAPYPGAIISPKSRQPRTAIGITQDGKELILMVADGRTFSIGATQDELAWLLLDYGAYNAMNFDGGGSSTMIAKTLDDEWLTVKNTLSEGSSRKIINGLGVFNKAGIGDITQLAIKTDQNKVFRGTPISIEVYGYDEYYNRIDIPYENIEITTDSEGKWLGQTTFAPSVTGDIGITAKYGEITATTTLKSLEVAQLQTDISSIGLEVGESVYMNLAGADSEGFKAKVDINTTNPEETNHVNFEVVPNTLGTVENGKFTATDGGEGYIKCSIGEVETYIPVVIGSKRVSINSFETIENEAVVFTSYPETLQGEAVITTEPKQTTDGQKALQLTFKFDITSSLTQAAYMDLLNPIEIQDKPTGLELDIYGDNSKYWLRGRIIDADGNSALIDFAKSINWDGWHKSKATLPSNLKYPIKLDRLYVAALSSDNADEHTIYMDNLQGIYNTPSSSVKLPASTNVSDNKKADLSTKELENSFDITLLPTITASEKTRPKDYQQIQSGIFEAFKKNSALGIFIGDANVESGSGVIKYSAGYNVSEYSNVGIVQMTAKNGGLRNTNPEQWKVFENDIMALNKDHIIIILDKNPLDFKDTKEKELFQTVMEKIYNSGKTIFVVSSDSTSSIKIDNGIRYIKLGSLFDANGAVNKNFRMLRLRISGETILYDFK